MRLHSFELTDPLPEFNQPHALAIIRPWIDVGSAGSLLLSSAEEKLSVREFATLARALLRRVSVLAEVHCGWRGQIEAREVLAAATEVPSLAPHAKKLRKSLVESVVLLPVDDMRRGRAVREVPEESLMLTGDENIVDVEFTVLWRIKPSGAADYLFNIQNPEGTVKAVAESAMREVVGRSEIQPILTGARQNIEAARRK